MKVSKSDLVLLFVAMGFKMAPKWAASVLSAKLLKIQSLLEADTTVADPKAAKLLKTIVKAQKAGETVEIVEGEEEAEEAPAPKKGKKVAEEEAPAPKGKKGKKAVVEDEEEEEEEEAPAPKKGKKAKPVAEEEEEAPAPKKGKKAKPVVEDEEEEEEDEDEAPAKGKKTKPAPAAPPKKVGVISAILSILGKATPKKPITKEHIVDKLVTMFPDRERDAMRSTVNTQVPTRINATHEDINIMRNEEGYYLEQST